MSTSIDDLLADLKEFEKKIDEFKKMEQNLGTRIDNMRLRNEMCVSRLSVGSIHWVDRET